MQVGDQLLKANDSITLYGKNINADWVRSKIRGEEGSTVKLTVLRDNKKVSAIWKWMSKPNLSGWSNMSGEPKSCKEP